jgi:hypothetical protein
MHGDDGGGFECAELSGTNFTEATNVSGWVLTFFGDASNMI